MNLFDLAKGQKIVVMTDAKVEVILEVESITSVTNSREIIPASRENDWQGTDQTWETYNVKFTNGFVKSYPSIGSIIFIE